MKPSEAKARIEMLRREIKEHNTKYYVYNQPVISDFEYDILINELETLEKKFPEFKSEDSPTQRVGSDIKNEFVQYEHQYPMLSLGNTYNEEEVREFDARTKRMVHDEFDYTCELKFDGASISIIYRNGKLFRALTRGDGIKGDDVTENVRTIKSVPLSVTGKSIPDEFTVRGEIVMPREVFENLNLERTGDNLAPFANPRNAAAGTLKLLDSKIAASRKLDCLIYTVLDRKSVV